MPKTKATEQQSLSERLDALIVEVGSLVEEIDAAGKAAVEQAEARVWQNLRFYNARRDELEELTTREQGLRAELEDLPLRHSRCVLEDDEAGASRTKSRYAEIRDELDTIATRRPCLESEVKDLAGPNISKLPDHLKPTGVQLRQRDLVSRALDVGLNPLTKLEREVAGPIKSALGRQKGRAADHVSTQQMLNSEISHDPMLAQRRREATRVHVNTARSGGA